MPILRHSQPLQGGQKKNYDKISAMPLAASLTIASNVWQLVRVREFVLQTASLLTKDKDAIEDLILALNEAVTNIILHGYQNQPGFIRVEVGGDQERLYVTLTDRSSPYDPTLAPVPDITLPLEKRKPGGLGVHMMRHLTDQILYTRTPEGENQLTLTKFILGEKNEPLS